MRRIAASVFVLAAVSLGATSGEATAANWLSPASVTHLRVATSSTDRTVVSPDRAVTTRAVPGKVDLLTQAGIRLDGAAGDMSGGAIAGAGDVNGDGRDDVIIGATGTDRPPSAGDNGFDAGSASVVYGRSPTSGELDLSALTPADGFRILGARGSDQAGFAVGGGGDVDGDGLDDVVVGAPYVDADGRTDAGATYVVYGARGAPAALDLKALTADRGFRIDGAAAGDFSGRAVAGGGDVNGDARDDVIVGANAADGPGRTDAGAAWVVYGTSGKPDSLALNGIATAQGFRIDGAVAGDSAGFAVADGGDVNGDRRADVLVGAPQADRPGRSNAGAAFVVYGPENVSATVDLAALTATRGARIDGSESGQAGFAVGGGGDVNGDGRGDVVVGAPFAGAARGRPDAGATFVLFGGQSLPATIDLTGAFAGLRIDGAVAGDSSGRAVAVAGDVNADGLADVLTGSNAADPSGRADAGVSHVVYGRTTTPPGPIDLATLTPADGLEIAGARAGEQSGIAVARAGDVDGDGGDDLIVGASVADNRGRTDSGSTYVVLGRTPAPPPGPGPTDPTTTGTDDTRPPDPPKADTTPPVLTLAAPVCAKRLKAAKCAAFRKTTKAYGTLAGTVQDAGGVSSVQVSLVRATGKGKTATCSAYAGRAFKRTTCAKAATTFVAATVRGGAWTLKPAGVKPGRYTLQVRATDTAGNVSAPLRRSLKLSSPPR